MTKFHLQISHTDFKHFIDTLTLPCTAGGVWEARSLPSSWGFETCCLLVSRARSTRAVPLSSSSPICVPCFCAFLLLMSCACILEYFILFISFYLYLMLLTTFWIKEKRYSCSVYVPIHVSCFQHKISASFFFIVRTW